MALPVSWGTHQVWEPLGFWFTGGVLGCDLGQGRKLCAGVGKAGAGLASLSMSRAGAWSLEHRKVHLTPVPMALRGHKFSQSHAALSIERSVLVSLPITVFGSLYPHVALQSKVYYSH